MTVDAFGELRHRREEVFEVRPLSTPASRPLCDGLSEVEICAALQAVLASSAFSNSPKLSAFLAFVVEQVLAGNAERINGYTIAVDALGRRDDFDPSTDAIVRVNANRIRRALQRHYATAGANDPVIIDLPCRHYVPTFKRRAHSSNALSRPLAGDRQTNAAPRQPIRDAINRLRQLLLRLRRWLEV